MANLNRIILIGRLTNDPEARTTMDGTPLTKFVLAVDRNRPSGMQKETDFIDIIAWRNLAEFSGSELAKGQLVLVEGRIQNRSFDTKEGVKRYITEVVASNMVPVEKGKAKVQLAAARPEPARQQSEGKDESFLEDDLPF